MEKEVNWSMIGYHSEIEITVRHMILLQSTINFEKFEAKILTKGNDLKTAVIDLCIDPTSLAASHTTNPDLLKRERIANDQYPSKIRFVSEMIEKPDKNGNHMLTGKLTIKEVARPVKLKIRFTKISHDPWGDATCGLLITGRLNRKHWGLGPKIFAEKGVFFLSNHMDVTCKIHMSKFNQETLINIQQEGLHNAKIVYSKKFNANSSSTASNDT
jgi:polyisoprenoid-binding protein YceI